MIVAILGDAFQLSDTGPRLAYRIAGNLSDTLRFLSFRRFCGVALASTGAGMAVAKAPHEFQQAKPLLATPRGGE